MSGVMDYTHSSTHALPFQQSWEKHFVLKTEHPSQLKPHVCMIGYGYMYTQRHGGILVLLVGMMSMVGVSEKVIISEGNESNNNSLTQYLISGREFKISTDTAYASYMVERLLSQNRSSSSLGPWLNSSLTFCLTRCILHSTVVRYVC